MIELALIPYVVVRLSFCRCDWSDCGRPGIGVRHDSERPDAPGAGWVPVCQAHLVGGWWRRPDADAPRTCLSCGTSLEERVPGAPGAPRKFCSLCREERTRLTKNANLRQSRAVKRAAGIPDKPHARPGVPHRRVVSLPRPDVVLSIERSAEPVDMVVIEVPAKVLRLLGASPDGGSISDYVTSILLRHIATRRDRYGRTG